MLSGRQKFLHISYIHIPVLLCLTFAGLVFCLFPSNSLSLLDSLKYIELFLKIKSHKPILNAVLPTWYKLFILSPWKDCNCERCQFPVSACGRVEQRALKHSPYLQTA